MPLPRGFKANANRLAIRVREQMRLASVAPLDPWMACDHFEIAVLKLSELVLPDGRLAGGQFLAGTGRSAFSALTMPVGGRRAIVHNDSHDESRQRSNIAHELAHCFLGHELTPPLLANGTRDRHSGIEEEAAFLGGALLIPNEAARHIVFGGMTRNEAAAHYGVSADMLTYRLRVSGAERMISRSVTRMSRAAPRL